MSIRGISARLLVVDDDVLLGRALARQLARSGYDVVVRNEGQAALEALREGGFEVVISDIEMPALDGIELLRAVRDFDRDLPVVLITGAPAIDTAAKAVEHGAFRYLTKPFEFEQLLSTVQRASQLYRLARMKREALSVLGTGSGEGADRLALEASFERALGSLWMAFQPIVWARDGSLFGYEALLRSDEPLLPHPAAMLDAAERVSGLQRLGRVIRQRAAEPMQHGPPGALLFMNLHPQDLADPVLHADDTLLASMASRVVLEVTERAALEGVPDVPSLIASLRARGFRVAIDDLGAGYAGLASFALLEPDIVKLDMSLVRDVHQSPVKQKLVRSMTQLCKDLGLLVVGEGVEVMEERSALIELGCDLLQGYFVARPGRPFPAIHW